MARHEGDLRGKIGQPLDAAELLALLESAGSERDGARACYLSSSDGWREAEKALGGAFAREQAPLTASEKE